MHWQHDPTYLANYPHDHPVTPEMIHRGILLKQDLNTFAIVGQVFVDQLVSKVTEWRHV